VSDRRTERGRANGGFTLIEVIGALVVFSVGVLMVIRLTGALGTQMRYAGVSSELAFQAGEKLDSLDRLTAGAMTVGTRIDTLVVFGRPYRRSLSVSRLTPILTTMVVSLTPVDGDGPAYSATSYRSGPW